MPRRPEILAFLLLGLAALRGLGAPSPDRSLFDDTLDDYLKQHALVTMRVFELEKRLPLTAGPERTKVLADLANAYEDLLESLPADQRQAVRERCRTLLKENPRPELAALRLNLLKGEYLAAEQAAERQRLHIGNEGDGAEAVQTLKRLALDFSEIALAASAKVRSLDTQDQARPDASAADAKELQDQLQEARRIRSLANYYAGWSDTYVAQLTRDRAYAGDALLHFGALLNAQERKPPTLDRLPKSLLIHEHVARACLGTAVCLAIVGNDAEALRWLDELSTADDLPAQVKSQLLARRIAILGAGSRWTELTTWVQRSRAPQGRITAPLEPTDAILLAVTAMEGADGPAPGGEKARTELARSALADLIAKGQTAYVVSLAKRYGTGALSSNGFVAQYVRALQAFDFARARHRTAGRAEDPAVESSLVLAYREAADLFLAATKAEDSGAFEPDARRAGLSAGMSLFYAGAYSLAADQFERLAKDSRDDAVRKDALWYAVVSLDRAVDAGQKNLADRRDAAAVFYVATYPKTEQAARLLLRRAGVGKLSDVEVVETLLAVPDSSPVRHEARVQAAGMLFKLARASPTADSDVAIARFLAVSDEVLPAERDAAISANSARRNLLAERVLTMCRQQLESALALSTPDIPRAERMLAEITRIGDLCAVPLTAIADELTFRKLQIAVSREDDAQISSLIASVRSSNSSFAQSARQRALRRAIEQFRARPEDLATADRVIAFGEPVLAALDAQKQFDARSNAVRDEVAGAAALAFGHTGNVAQRDLAIRIDRDMYERGGRFTSSLRRLAELSENAGDTKTALECWKILVAGLREEQPSWFEASYNAIRLMARSDSSAARDAIRLLELSHPNFGPPPWSAKLRALRESLPDSPPPASSKGSGS